MNRVDLAEFQFDYDLKWAAVFKHADGAVFGRYGSHSPSGPMGNNSMAGLRRTLERVLEAHRDYPANRANFAAKKGPVPLYRQVSEAPSRRIRKILAKRGREGCVHCHNIYDAYHDRAVDAGTYDPQTVWKYPLPENVGLQIDPNDGRRIASVEPESPAARAGLRVGDRVSTLHGQPIYSIADFQFVLHGLGRSRSGETVSAGDEITRAVAVVRRGEETVEAPLELSGTWRRGDLSWRGSMWAMPPSPGLWVAGLDADVRRERGIAAGRLALEVRGVFRKAVRRAGLRKGDVIVAYDGRDEEISAPKFHADLRLRYYRPGAVLRLDVLRRGNRVPLEVRF